MKDFNEDDLIFFLPNTFKGLTKKYLLDCIFEPDIQDNWKPKLGDIIIGGTGNIFVISSHDKMHEKLGGDQC